MKGIAEMLLVIVGKLLELVARLGMEVQIWAVNMCEGRCRNRLKMQEPKLKKSEKRAENGKR